MPRLTRRGLSLLELVVALTLSGVAATAATGVLRQARHAFRNQSARIGVNRDVRAAMLIITAEVRKLHAQDPDGSDIVAMTPSALTYRASRGARFLCRPPDVAGMRVTLSAEPRWGDPIGVGNALLYADLDSTSNGRGRWLRVSATGLTEGIPCPGGSKGTTVRLADASPAQLAMVESGAPFLVTELTRIQAYPDANGSYWLGARAWNDNGTWSEIQPFAGPVAAGGLEFAYFDSDGGLAGSPATVTRIGVAVTGRTLDFPFLTFRLEASASLRDGPR